MIEIFDLLSDEVIEHPVFGALGGATREEWNHTMTHNPNLWLLNNGASILDRLDPDKESRNHKGMVNFMRWMVCKFEDDPWFNSRLGWLMWYLTCYARPDSYFPMKFCRHYEPREFYMPGEPIRAFEFVDPDNPYNLDHTPKRKGPAVFKF
jgi:hypothetical protein